MDEYRFYELANMIPSGDAGRKLDEFLTTSDVDMTAFHSAIAGNVTMAIALWRIATPPMTLWPITRTVGATWP